MSEQRTDTGAFEAFANATRDAFGEARETLTKRALTEQRLTTVEVCVILAMEAIWNAALAIATGNIDLDDFDGAFEEGIQDAKKFIAEQQEKRRRPN